MKTNTAKESRLSMNLLATLLLGLTAQPGTVKADKHPETKTGDVTFSILRASTNSGGKHSAFPITLFGVLGEPVSGTSNGDGYSLSSGFLQESDLIFRTNFNQ